MTKKALTERAKCGWIVLQKTKEQSIHPPPSRAGRRCRGARRSKLCPNSPSSLPPSVPPAPRRRAPALLIRRSASSSSRSRPISRPVRPQGAMSAPSCCPSSCPSNAPFSLPSRFASRPNPARRCRRARRVLGVCRVPAWLPSRFWRVCPPASRRRLWRAPALACGARFVGASFRRRNRPPWLPGSGAGWLSARPLPAGARSAPAGSARRRCCLAYRSAWLLASACPIPMQPRRPHRRHRRFFAIVANAFVAVNIDIKNTLKSSLIRNF